MKAGRSISLMHDKHFSSEFNRRSVTQQKIDGIEYGFFHMRALNMDFFYYRSWSERMSAVIHALLPGSCALCRGESRGAVCDVCSAQFFAPSAIRCAICALRLQHPNLQWCATCLRSPPAYDATIVACDYLAPADALIKDLKFRACLPLAEAFAQRVAQAMQTQLPDFPELMVPVPLSEARLVARGFNQAAEIARSLARRTGIPLQLHLCARIRDTKAQAGLPVSQRRVNMRGAFTARLDANTLTQLRGRHVLVVDDVMTTGHTLNEFAACLKRQGAARVTNAVFARTPQH